MKTTPRRNTAYQYPLFTEETVTMQFVADLLGSSLSSVRRYLEDGRLRGYKKCVHDGPCRCQWHIFKNSLDAFQAGILEKYGLNLTDINGGKGQK